MKVIIIKKIGIIVIFLILALSLTCVSANEITNESQDDTLKVSEDIDNLESESTQDQLSSAQLELDNDADKENINLGDEVTWIVTAQNFGPDTAKNVKVYDKLPSGLKYVKHTTTKGTFDPETGIWDIGDLKVSDGMVTLKITTVAESTGEKVNKAYLTSDNCDDIYEEEEIDVFSQKVSKDIHTASATMHETGNPIFLALITLFMLCAPVFKRK